MADKCPKCGAEESSEDGCGKRFLCGSLLMSYGQFFYSPMCAENVSKELATLKSRHAKLVEAADKIAQLALPVHGRPSFFVSEGMINALKKALESEPANNQKPADQGCPFDEALESEAKR